MRGIPPSDWLKHQTFYKHIGIYAYRSQTLQNITQLPVSALEKAESLEQLRWIENGFKIHTLVTELETLAVDTPEDLEVLIKKLTARN